MISIKIKLKDDNNYNVEHITNCLNTIIAKYAEKNGNTNDALIFDLCPRMYIKSCWRNAVRKK